MLLQQLHSHFPRAKFVSLSSSRIVGVFSSVSIALSSEALASNIGHKILLYQGIAGSQSPISPISISILAGVCLNSVLPVNVLAYLKPGLTFMSKNVLPLSIVCLGIKLSFVDLFTSGLIGIPVVVSSVMAGYFFIPWLGKKLGVNEKMSALISTGTSICGVTAISALSPVIKADPKDTSFAIANVVLVYLLNDN